jgi:diguanylate cyclase (GGDEF)-like protein
MTDSSESEKLSRVVDDYILWFTAWHQLTALDPAERTAHLDDITPPESFTVWRNNAFATLTLDQPAIEKIAGHVEQLHTLVKLVLMKTPGDQMLPARDSDSITAKYKELMRDLRRCESAFAAAASGLDALTGLRSRDGLWRELEHEMQRFVRSGRPFCIAMMDVDHFKKINDNYGHDAGDRVLASVADHVSRKLRSHDDAFRFGGEEFLLCLKDADLATGMQVLERLRQSLADTPVTLNSATAIPVTASFGLAVSSDVSTVNELLRRADAALYRAKHEGRNRVVTAESLPMIEARG